MQIRAQMKDERRDSIAPLVLSELDPEVELEGKKEEERGGTTTENEKEGAGLEGNARFHKMRRGKCVL